MLRRFFDVHLSPKHEEWLTSPLDERRAMNAVAAVNNMAAWTPLLVRARQYKSVRHPKR
jgi:hypothetical protein